MRFIVLLALLTLIGCGKSKNLSSDKSDTNRLIRCGVELFQNNAPYIRRYVYTKVGLVEKVTPNLRRDPPDDGEGNAILVPGTYIRKGEPLRTGVCAFQIEPDSSVGPETTIALE